MVAAEEERGASISSPAARSSSSSESSDESGESEAEGQGCADSRERGGGGVTRKDSPPQLQPTSATSPIPQEPTSTAVRLAARGADAVPSASPGSRQLIQELGEMRISQGSTAERSGSQLASAAAETTEGTSGRSSSGTLLEALCSW